MAVQCGGILKVDVCCPQYSCRIDFFSCGVKWKKGEQ